MTFRRNSLIWVRTALVIFIIVLMLLGSLNALVTRAQDVTEEPTLTATDPVPELTPVVEPTVIVVTPDPTPVPPVEPPEELPPTPPEDVLSRLLALLNDASYIVWAAAGVVIITGAIKMLAGLAGIRIEGVAAALLALFIQVAVWLAYTVANSFGAGEAFRTQYNNVVDVIRSLLPLVGSIFGGHVLYQAAAKRNVPILGYHAPPKLKEYKASVEVKSSGEGKDWTPSGRH